ncbi:hypothetical protein [Micromonospora sp. NPDC047074]|uniref:hypothetical protein n=1 Tax=Micromonospora sp. NPDC047074 TaxID=3154339 RepID=UPI0034109032
MVTAIAPEELPLVGGLSSLDDAEVARRLVRRSRTREPLGFGLGEIVALATPVVWLVVDETARRVAGAGVDGAARRLSPLLRRILRRKAAPVTVPPLTRAQLGEVRHRVLEAAAQQGFDEARATAIADAVVARLALVGDGGATEEPAP